VIISIRIMWRDFVLQAAVNGACLLERQSEVHYRLQYTTRAGQRQREPRLAASVFLISGFACFSGKLTSIEPIRSCSHV
jgi:hypothetical protein